MKRTILFLTCVLATITMSARYEADGIVSFTKGQRATIILPITPDADKGRYYRLDRVENYQIIFEEEPHPQARVPYIIIPNEDFSIDVSTLDLTGIWRDSTNIYGVSFIGTYVKDVIGYKDSYYYYTIDSTSDCYNDQKGYDVYMGPLRAFIQVRIWNHGEKMPFVIHDAGSEPTPQDDYHPLLEEGKAWTYHYHGYNGREFNVGRIIDGDTIISGQAYKKIYDKVGGQYQYALREEGKKVYMVDDHYETESLLYDFSKDAGDVIDELVYPLIVASVDTIDIDGVKFRRMRVQDANQPVEEWDDEMINMYNFWIEGVGSECLLESSIRGNGNYYNLLSCQINGRVYTQQELLGNGSEPTPNEIAINETNFPDINFRNWLLSQEYGKDGILTDEEISDITEINVEKKDIANLQGIEKFTSLTSLYCSINELTTLDLSGCPQLNALDCSFNKQLASINLSGCKALQHLYCHGCKLTAIDLTDCTELIYLDCGTNLLTTIDPSPCQKVMSFVCSRNQLTTIDISACKALRSFDCQENQLTTLDCSGLTELQAILCAMNALTSINISGCSKLIHLLCEFNNLGLDAFQHIMTNIPERDESDEAFMFVYSESTIEGSYDHTPDHNICSKEQVAIAKAKGWVVYYENNTGDSLPYEGVEVTPEIAYRPFIEDDKVWKVGGKDSGNPVKFVTYYYFDGDTIIGGKTCKQMMCQRYLSPDCPHSSFYDYWAQLPSLSKVGAWYEKDKKVYFCREGTQGMYMLYDFSLEVNDTLILNLYQPYYTVGPKQTGGLNGFKGVYRDIMLCGQDIYITTWLEGVGGIDGPLRNVYPETGSDPQFLMSCTVGDEVIYLNDEYEDGATPSMETKKRRFDFTHTVKIQPKTPRRGEETALYGEYNDQSLDIRLDSLDEAYLVRNTDKSGKVVYEKTINAGSIVGLNIDISTYPEGQYTITIENSKETFTGEFDTSATAIAEIVNGKSSNGKSIFNLQGQRIKTLQNGLNIVDGKKIFVK